MESRRGMQDRRAGPGVRAATGQPEQDRGPVVVASAVGGGTGAAVV